MMMMKKRPAPTKRAAAPAKRSRIGTMTKTAISAAKLPYVAYFDEELREVYFVNLNYSRLGSDKMNDGECVPVWEGGSAFHVWAPSPVGINAYSPEWRHAQRTDPVPLPSNLGAALRRKFFGYTVLFEESDPHQIVPLELADCVVHRVLPTVRSSEGRINSSSWRNDVREKRIATLAEDDAAYAAAHAIEEAVM